MKKIISVLLTLFMAGSIFAAQKRIVILTPTTEGISEEEQNWLPSSIRRKFEANFNDYTGYQIVDMQNETEIKKLQQKAETNAYDQNTSLELGKLVSAEYALFSTITKAGDRYILSANVTDLTTGIRLSSVSANSVLDTVLLFEGAGCSVNSITVKLCEDLNIPLSSIDLYMLMKGQDLSEKDEISMTKEELGKYEKKQSDLEAQLQKVALSGDIDAETKKAKLEAEKALAEQQKEIAKEKLDRLQKEQERLLQDQELQKKRSAQQVEKIKEAAAKAEASAKLVKNAKIDNLTIDAQIAVIEAKKQALADINYSIETQIDYIKQLANDKYKEQCAIIDAEPLRNAEMDADGNILPGVKKKRDEKKKEIRNQIEQQALDDIKQIEKTTENQEQSLINEINKDRAKLKEPRTINSLEDDRILDIGNYAGEKYEWQSAISLYISDVKIFSQNANISYRAVSSKQPVLPSDSDNSKWEDYLDTVDLYDYMFNRKVPVVYAEVDYSVEAMPDNYPSMYKINLSEIRFVDTNTSKVIQVIKPAKTSYKFTVTPIVDVSAFSSKLNQNITSDKQEAKQSKSEAAPKKEKKQNNKNPVFDQSQGGGNRFNLGVTFGAAPRLQELYNDDIGTLISGYFSVPITPYFFGQIDVDALQVPPKFGSYTCDEALLNVGVSLGFNYRLKLGNWYPDLYILAGIGVASSDDLYNKYRNKIDSLWYYKYGAGIDFPITENTCFSVEVGMQQLECFEQSEYYKFGIALTLPD